MSTHELILTQVTYVGLAGSVVVLVVSAVLGYTDVRLQKAGIAGLSAAFDAYMLLLGGPLAAGAVVLSGAVGAGLSNPVSAWRGFRSLAARGLGVGAGALLLMLSERAMSRSGQSLIWMAVVVWVCLTVQLLAFSWISVRVEGHWEYAISRSLLERQLPMFLAQVSAVLLATAVQSAMGTWALPLLLVLLLLVRQSYVLLAQVSESYLRTLEVLVRASEGAAQAGRTNSEVASELARKIAIRLGLSAAGVQRAVYTTLLCALSGISHEATPSQIASRIVSQVGLFSGVVETLQLIEGRLVNDEVPDVDLTIAWVAIRSWDHVCAERGVDPVIPAASREAVRGAMTSEARVRVSRAMVGLGIEI